MSPSATTPTSSRMDLTSPSKWHADVKKGVGGLGMILRKNSSGDCVVGDLREGGAVNEWNRRHPQQAFQRGDRVLSVNGQSGTAQEIIAAVKQSSEDVSFVLERGPESP